MPAILTGYISVFIRTNGMFVVLCCRPCSYVIGSVLQNLQSYLLFSSAGYAVCCSVLQNPKKCLFCHEGPAVMQLSS